jgi:hypothetical protein
MSDLNMARATSLKAPNIPKLNFAKEMEKLSDAYTL